METLKELVELISLQKIRQIKLVTEDKDLNSKSKQLYDSIASNEISSDELERWLILEKERFRRPVLRLFHTELETVYEEYNRAMDNAGRKIQNALMQGLFPTHPYGHHDIIGKPEHLKNPSIKNIYNFWKVYYTPQNMAICMSGDFEYDTTINLIAKYFRSWYPE